MIKRLPVILLFLTIVIIYVTPNLAYGKSKKKIPEITILHKKIYMTCIIDSTNSYIVDTEISTDLKFNENIVRLHLTKTHETIAKISAYNAEKSQNGPDPFTTASGIRVCEGIVAVSRDLFKKGWTFGKFVLINGKVYIIADIMGKQASKHIDVFMWSKPQAFEHGVQKHTVMLLEKIADS